MKSYDALSSALERVERPLPDIWQNRENGWQ